MATHHRPSSNSNSDLLPSSRQTHSLWCSKWCKTWEVHQGDNPVESTLSSKWCSRCRVKEVSQVVKILWIYFKDYLDLLLAVRHLDKLPLNLHLPASQLLQARLSNPLVSHMDSRFQLTLVKTVDKLASLSKSESRCLKLKLMVNLSNSKYVSISRGTSLKVKHHHRLPHRHKAPELHHQVPAHLQMRLWSDYLIRHSTILVLCATEWWETMLSSQALLWSPFLSIEIQFIF